MQLGGNNWSGESYVQVIKVYSFYCPQKRLVMMTTTGDVRLARSVGRMEVVMMTTTGDVRLARRVGRMEVMMRRCEIGEACRTHGRSEKCMRNFGRRN